MSLNTRFVVIGPTPARTVWDKVLADLEAFSTRGAPAIWNFSATSEVRPWRDPDPGESIYHTVIGQGLPAALEVTSHRDGYVEFQGVKGCVLVSWDTGYGYMGPHGGCSDLHQSLTASLAAWCDERNLRWLAYDEFWDDSMPAALPPVRRTPRHPGVMKGCQPCS